MNGTKISSASAALVGLLFLGAAMHSSSRAGQMEPRYRVLPPSSRGDLTVYPIVADSNFDTSKFMTLDEGIRSGQVVVTESRAEISLVRPRHPVRDGVWNERIPGAQVNELALVNNSDHPLILLAGEIVTGGKQDRIVGTDRIIPANSEPISLSVFCVEPHRWTDTCQIRKPPLLHGSTERSQRSFGQQRSASRLERGGKISSFVRRGSSSLSARAQIFLVLRHRR